VTVGAVKDEISAGLARSLAGELIAAWPEFPHRRFMSGLRATLDPLELLARVDLLADRLVASLPPCFDAAAAVLWRALASPTFTGWMTWPCGSFVARRGMDCPETALPLLAGLTPRWSSEFAVRPFIDRHPDLTYGFLRRWVTDDDAHVRRLVSEGTRPRLPWAPRLRDLVEDPAPNVVLLDALADDPSPYVRRSVANHLNDIAKDHPDLAVALARRWHDRGERGAWIARHGLRTLVKRGDTGALTVLGVETDVDVTVRDVTVDCERVPIGGSVAITFTIELASGPPADAMIDYRVHYMGARATRAPKVFKLARRRLVAGQPETLRLTHRFEPVSIRTIHPGPHTIDVQVNGSVLTAVTVEVEGPLTS
jgi:3-methyladenine DNA glycosylase AlkC